MAGCGNPSTTPPVVSPNAPVYQPAKSEIVLPCTLVFSNTISEALLGQLMDSGAKVMNNGSGPPFYLHFDAVDSDAKRFAVNAALLNGAHIVEGGDK